FYSKEFTLYVSDLPEELNKHGLLQIFNHYGEIKGYFYRPNANWAYITYDAYCKAESAIDLHNVPPLRLKLSFAKEKTTSVKNTKISVPKHVIEQYENHNEINLALEDKQLIQPEGRGRPLDIFKKIKPNPGLPKYLYTADNDLLYPYPSEPHIYNPYENAEPYASTNTLWTRGQLTITPTGKRHVSFGRGYTMYEIPSPDIEICNHINTVYEKRNAGLYEYGKDTLQNAIGICSVCSKKTKYTCERCNTFYCNRICQVTDWPQHKIECEAIPALVTTMYSMPVLQSNNEEQTLIKNVSNIQLPLRRPKKLINATINSNEVLNVASEKKDIISSEESKTYLHKQPIEISNNKAKSTPKADNQKNVKKLQKFNASNIQKMENDMSFSKKPFLSKTKFQDVIIIIKENRECWVQKVEDQNTIKDLMTEIQAEIKAQKMEPIVGNIYAVKYENVWHRAIVTCLNPVKVHYIDYGNDEVVETNDFRKIDKYANVPRLCAKIRLSQKAYKKYKDLKYEDIISVKMISVDSNNVINVEVKNENDISTSEIIQIDNNSKLNTSTIVKVDDKTVISPKISTKDKALISSNKIKNIVNTVTVGEIGILEIHAEIKNNTYSITLLPNNAVPDYEKLLINLPEVCAQTAECSNHRPKIGDLVCGQRVDGDWLRGYILSLQPSLKMAIIDEARIMPINKTIKCDKNFSNIYAFGAVLEITDAKHKFNEGDQYEFKVTPQTINYEQNTVEIEISKEQFKIKAIVKPWTPMPEQKGLQYAELKNGSEVLLTSYRSHTLLFVRSLDITELEHYNHVMQNIAKCAQTSPFLKEPPVVGQMVIAQYADGNYYRAIVTKIEDDKITISYVDFGNTEVTNIKKLKILSDNLKQLRSCTTKVTLKDVSKDVPMTKEASDYLACLVATEVPLLCTFDGIPFQDGVYLNRHNEKTVNKIISELLVPTTRETCEEDKTCYMMEHLSIVDLGKVGDVVEGLVLYSVEDGYRYAICPLDYDLMTHVFDIMPKKITAFCETTDHYIPRKSELCLALYADKWYRGVCLNPRYSPTTCIIFFVDFGNSEIVKHKDIRLMPKDFVTPCALANICNIVNIAPTDNNGQYSSEVKKRISELILPDNFIKIKIVDCELESKIYSVELPLVKDKLIEEGLISS
ncbi:Tudor domain-containing protein 1, partial [Melipona quadrifasciata]